MKRTVYGPSLRETAYALHAVDAADRFLNAYLDGEVTSALIRELSDQINDITSVITGTLDSRAEDLLELPWSNAVVKDGMLELEVDDDE